MSSRKSQKKSVASNTKQGYSFVSYSYSSSSIATPEKIVKQELTFKNNSGKVSGKYIAQENGKKVINKEFKNQREFDALQKRLIKQQKRK